MNTNEPPDNDEPEFITPQNITPEQRARIAKQTNEELEDYFSRKLPQMIAATKDAVANRDAEALKRAASGIAAFSSKLSQWNDACGENASANLVACVETMGQMRDDIHAALNGELPEQQDDDSADDWKKH